MSERTKAIGIRIRNYRLQAGLTQDKLAELADCHPTYIGQIERGEKNLTVESLARISVSLKVPLNTLLEKIDDLDINGTKRNIPLEAYNFFTSKTVSEQEQLLDLLKEIDKYRNA